MRRLNNFEEYKTILPYASEIFGLYQPLMGWKSERAKNRVDEGFYNDKVALINKVKNQYVGEYLIDLNDDFNLKINVADKVSALPHFNSTIMQEIVNKLPSEEEMNNDKWKKIINHESMEKMLSKNVKEDVTKWIIKSELPKDAVYSGKQIQEAKLKTLETKLNNESVISGLMLDLVQNKQYNVLKQMFYKQKNDIQSMLKRTKYNDPFDLIDPKKELDRVGLSPVGIVHLFRQYFFEFDTFLGIPVGHIWVSPGSTVELIEISTRKTTAEKYLELQTETSVKAETSITDQDEVSDAIKEDNKNEIKFGANVTANENWIWGSASQSASFDMNNTQQTAREQTHKHMRQQSEKLSTEIRKNYKSTFKVITEYTDASNKRYVLTNSTNKLINYELRRKMRNVGVQVQDIGTYLCWETYVDEPGRELGVANLVHIAASPDIDQIPHPEEIVAKKPFTEKVNIQIPFVGTDTDDKDQAFIRGENDTLIDEHIEWKFPQRVICKEANYYLDNVILQSPGEELKATTDFDVTQINKDLNEATFTIYLDYVHFHDKNTINIEASLYWKPNQDMNAIKAANEKKIAEYTQKVEYAHKKEYVDAAKERIKLASNIQPRKYEDLREEERIVVYRKLIQDLLAPERKIPQPDSRTRHVVSELINSIFDTDKMLYFVAPEWWKPKYHYDQSFGVMKPTSNIGKDGTPELKPDLTNTITNENLVSWGGIEEKGRDNYYITDDSIPAKLGSSLGWLLELDGDNMRNAFLNAPWVKAVIPIRPGKEKAALNWLKQIEGNNGITENDVYTGNEPELKGKNMLEVLEVLATKVKNKHLKSSETSEYIPDPANTGDSVTATPVDKVYEHGFYPLQGGFKVRPDEDFEIFDQWVEVLPTDQVVAVEVKYDPKTGRQI